MAPSNCRAQATPGGRWSMGWLANRPPVQVTQAQGRRRARALGLTPSQVPSGGWLVVYVLHHGWLTLPPSQVDVTSIIRK